MEISETSDEAAKDNDVPWVARVAPESNFFKATDFSRRTFNVHQSLQSIKKALAQKDLLSNWLSPNEIEYLINQLPSQLDITLFENNTYSQNYIIGADNSLFIRSFFFQTLILMLKEEFATFLLFLHILTQLDDEIFEKINHHTRKFTERFLGSRRHLIENDLDYKLIYELPYKQFNDFLLATAFTALVHTNKPLEEFTYLEKKKLSEIIFAKKIKRFLGIEEKSYQYIEQSSLIETQCNKQEQEQFYALKELFEHQKKDFKSFIKDELQNKQILFWCSWTISPFLAPDIGIFLKQLNESYTIKKVYTDLPTECTEAIHAYIKQQANSTHAHEKLLTQEIEKIYPIFIPDYAKETLPYTVFFENLKTLQIPSNSIECIGVDGDELMMKRPKMSTQEDRLIFSIDNLWAQKTLEAINLADQLASDEIIIFFYFLKPVYSFLPELIQHPGVFRMLHTDAFTGFGPEKPINSLARYSKHTPNPVQSFAFTDITNSPLINENIIFYPHAFQENNLKLDDTPFNTFKLYNSILYSTTKGDGGELETVTPKQDVHFSS